MKKKFDPRMHSAEHILNQTMDRIYQCGRCFNAHIEQKKSKLSVSVITTTHPASARMSNQPPKSVNLSSPPPLLKMVSCELGISLEPVERVVPLSKGPRPCL